MYSAGAGGVRQDTAKAVELYTWGCENQSYYGCYNLGLMYQEGRTGVAIDKQKALVLYKKSCDGGYASGCTSYASLLDSGVSLPADPTRPRRKRSH